MKNKLTALLWILLAMTSLSVSAQNANRFPLLRERLAQAKLYEIQQRIRLDQKAFEKFSPIYLKYEQEISEINFRKLARLTQDNPDSLTSDEAKQLIIYQLTSARKLIDIREKYFKEFSTVLSPQQIIKIFQTEAEIRKKVAKEMIRRKIGN